MARFDSYNIVVVGDIDVGKTTFIHQFVLNSFIEQIEPTACSEGIRKQVVVGDRSCLIQTLDTVTSTDSSYQEWMQRYSKQQILNADAAILMYSVTSRKSFNQVARLYNAIVGVVADLLNQEIRSKDLTSPLNITRGRSIPICLVGNKIDLHTAREVSSVEGAQLAKSLECSFLEASAKWEHTVSKAFCNLILAIGQGAEDGQQLVEGKAGPDEAPGDSAETKSHFRRLLNRVSHIIRH